ncbi:hypothetical protein [Streptomyces sp. NPDC051576]|uniref:hypothetical protein n=1 Tax=Streptomyces sp. NPDC051576 TaxID=3155803 RepID=UPI0034162769
MTGPSYTSDPAEIVNGSRVIEDLGGYAVEVGVSARAALADTSWTGDDGYGRQLRKEFVRTRDSVLATIDAIAAGISAVGEGTLGNLRSIRGTQGGILDAIHEQGGRSGSRP